MKKSKGFALVELLAAISILVAVLGISGVNTVNLQANLNQTKADTMAQQIYVSAQEKITKLYVSGEKVKLNQQRKFEYNPDNYIGDEKLEYIYSFDTDIDDFCDEEKEGTYVIEFDPVCGRVFGVFWSSAKLDFYTRSKDDDALRNCTQETYKKFAKENGYNISYYGGTILNSNLPDQPEDIPDDDPDDPPNVDPEDPVSFGDAGFVYWEEYTDKSYGVYYVYNFTDAIAHEGSTLKEEVVVADGYGIVIGHKSNTNIYVSLKGSVNDAVRYYDNPTGNVDLGDGVLYKFPTSWVDAKQTKANEFYTKLNFWVLDKQVSTPSGLKNSEVLYTNMHFAKNGIYVGKSNGGKYNSGHVAGDFYVRSPRQLYDLTLYYSLFSHGGELGEFIQDTNIVYDGYQYKNNTTTVSSNNKPSQTKIDQLDFYVYYNNLEKYKITY